MSSEKRRSPPSKDNDNGKSIAERQEKAEEETTPDQERGERIATGKAIARGGKQSGHVPGATSNDKK
jgi:hypothetical protein